MYREKLMQAKKNKIAGLYPICKLWLLGLYVLLIVMANTIKICQLSLLLIPLSLCIPIMFVISGQPKDFLKYIHMIKYLLFFLFFIQTFLLKGNAPVLLWKWEFLHIYLGGLQKGLSLSFNVFNFGGIFYWLFKTSTYQEISVALEQNGLNHKAAYIFLSTFKMIDVLQDSTNSIMDAQRARGVETEGNVFVRAKAFIPIIIPLIVNSMMSVGERALTLESKAYSLKCKKTVLIPVQKNGYETYAIIVGMIITICAAGGTILWLIR